MLFNYYHNPEEHTVIISILMMQKLRLREIKRPHNYYVILYEIANDLVVFNENSNCMWFSLIVTDRSRFQIQRQRLCHVPCG